MPAGDEIPSRLAAAQIRLALSRRTGDLDAAVENALLLEWACSVYWHASALGQPRALGPEQQREVLAAVLERGYGAPRRLSG